MLHGAKRKLARLRNKEQSVSSEVSLEDGTRETAVEGRRASSPSRDTNNSNHPRRDSQGPKLSKPSTNTKVLQSSRNAASVGTSAGGGGGGSGPSVSHSKSAEAVKEERSCVRLSDNGTTRVQDRGAKRKYGIFCDMIDCSDNNFNLHLHSYACDSVVAELKEHKDLIPLICSTSSPTIIRCSTGNQLSSQHKRKLRSISLNPANDTLFATRYAECLVLKDCFSL